jgi:hypothetical protein
MSNASLIHLDVAAWCSTSTLGQRLPARRLRAHLTAMIDAGRLVVCDFSGVDVLTSQFMDECFGKLWDHFPHNQLRAQLRIRHLTGNNRAIWRFVLTHRDVPDFSLKVGLTHE